MARRSSNLRDRILDIAERAFASEGIDALSLRSIASSAGVSLSHLQHYFPSKRHLVEACFARCIGPINAARCERLNSLIRSREPIDVEQVVDAWIRPLIDTHHPERAVVVMRFIARLLTAAAGPEYMRESYDEVGRCAIAALKCALPDDDFADLVWKYNFMIGVTLFTLGGQFLMARLPKEFTHIQQSYDPQLVDAEITLQRLVKFVSAGMAARLPALMAVSNSAPSDQTGRAAMRATELRNAAEKGSGKCGNHREPRMRRSRQK